MPPTSQQVGADIAARRRDAGLSQARLAGEARCSRATVAMLEGGYVPRHSEVVPRIEAVLETHLKRNATEANRGVAETTEAAVGCVRQ